jgi:MFS family permease
MTAIVSPDAHVLGVRDFRLFLSGRALSNLSIQMQSVAVGWQVYDLTNDPLALGYVGLAVFLPVACLTLPAGDAADRFDRRFILAASYGLQALCAAAFLALTLTGETVVWPFYLVMALFGVGRAFAGPAAQSFVPFLVARPQVTRAIAWSASAYQTAAMLGPALGGVIYIVGPAAVYGTCLALFVVVFASIAGIRTRVRPGATEAGMTALQRLLAGIAFVRRKPIVLGAATLDMFAVLLGGATALLPVYARDILHVGPGGLGILRSAMAVGGVATALAVAHYSIARRAGLTMFGAIAVFGIATLVFGVSESFTLSLIALTIMGMADQISVVTRNTLVQLATPEGMRGRVSALHMLFVGTSNEFGEFRAGTMAAWLGAVPAVLLGGAGILGVVSLWMWLFPDLRKIDRLSDVAPAP